MNMDELDTKVEVGKDTVTTPFSDGLVFARLNGLTMIPRTGDTEVELLREFFKYFASANPFVGNISTKSSFMKKKGGRLL